MKACARAPGEATPARGAGGTIAALRASPGSWGARPVLVYGFDDLTRAQFELIRTLGEAARVVIAVNYSDREALNARARLAAQLDDELPIESTHVLDHDPSYTARESLRHLDRGLFEPGSGRVAIDGAVTLLECAGELGEAEAIGGRIAALLAVGVSPDAITVVVRDPARRGPLLGRVLRRLAIPAAVEASVPLAGTAVGGSLVALCRAVAADDPEALRVHLRADPSTPPGVGDTLELTIHRERPATIDEAVGGWSRPPRHLAAVRAARPGAERMRALALIARELAESPHAQVAPLAGDGAAGATPFEPTELRAAAVAAELFTELAEVGALPGCDPPDLEAAAEALESATVRLWRGPAEGRVRVLDPYSVRAGRARHLFCAGLQEGEFPRRSPGDPLLGDERRARLGIASLARRDPLDEERYLFHACVSRPTEHLYLAWQAADDDGAPAARSPFIDEILDLLGPDSETAERELVVRRGLEQVTFELDEAPTAPELARARALSGPRIAEIKPGPLAVPAVLDELATRELLSASTLEQWIECPYRWFVEHELSPQRLDPQSDALRLGTVAHDALERLYARPPGDDSIPRPADVERWRARLAELLDEVAAEQGMRPGTPPDSIALARLARPDRLLSGRGGGSRDRDAPPGRPARGRVRLRRRRRRAARDRRREAAGTDRPHRPLPRRLGGAGSRLQDRQGGRRAQDAGDAAESSSFSSTSSPPANSSG